MGHHPEAAQDHRDVQEDGDEETVPGLVILDDGHALHQRPPYADQHLGELAEAEAHQRAVRVNQQFLCCWRLRNQHELEAAPRPRGRPPGSKNKPKPPELPLPKSKRMIADLPTKWTPASGAQVSPCFD